MSPVQTLAHRRARDRLPVQAFDRTEVGELRLPLPDVPSVLRTERAGCDEPQMPEHRRRRRVDRTRGRAIMACLFALSPHAQSRTYNDHRTVAPTESERRTTRFAGVSALKLVSGSSRLNDARETGNWVIWFGHGHRADADHTAADRSGGRPSARSHRRRAAEPTRSVLADTACRAQRLRHTWTNGASLGTRTACVARRHRGVAAATHSVRLDRSDRRSPGQRWGCPVARWHGRHCDGRGRRVHRSCRSATSGQVLARAGGVRVRAGQHVRRLRR